MPCWRVKVQNTAFNRASRRGARSEKRSQERKFSPCCNTRSQALVFTFSASGVLPILLRFNCWPSFVLSYPCRPFR
ncbi:hypothetical protein SPAB_05715 [Salmonella enterica subsp. enterica serovar Paratyphi B str. SPB7]|uniref:Uncharacterized protein n=1 Tax=Salmonella paratyphi B (strain ATCC BAA-1250 / SPB7) TaxID=1016998 RepID=A0A6C6ZA72_SALPB|nr:hypothetical protein SPAB_05715 [Salmonella enterica subsp. enterica serovar Paratyphi B str. SPB7]